MNLRGEEGVVTSSSQIIIPDSLRQNLIPADANNVVDALVGINKALLEHLVNDLGFALSSEGGGVAPSSHVSYSAVASERPVSIDYFQAAAPYVTDDITNGQTGVSVDVFDPVRAPEQNDDLGGIALRSKLSIERGAAQNERVAGRVKIKIGTMTANAEHGIIALERRALAG